MAYSKERRSNMAYSTVNAPAKKQGAGGAFTFGSAKDTTDYGELSGPPTQPTGVVVELAPASVELPAQAEEFDMQDASFPALGGPDAKAPPPEKKVWGAPAVAPLTPEPSGRLDPARLRQGVEFDSSHPRNHFAKKPHHREESGGVVEQFQCNTDGASDGVPRELQSQTTNGSQNAAHLSKYQQLPPAQVPLKELTKHALPLAKHSDKAAHSFAPRPMRELVNRGR